MADERTWLLNLQRYLFELLQPIIPEDTTRMKYVESKPMITWARAFTHETYSPKINYEELEFLGDAVLKLIFPLYLFNKYPYLTKKGYTELNSAYMSRTPQGLLSRRLRLGDHVRLKGVDKSNLNVDADVFESFFGALFTISDKIVTNGMGYVNSNNMLIYIFSSINIELGFGELPAKTAVQQIFMRLHLSKPIEESEILPNSGDHKMSISLSQEQIYYLYRKNIRISDPLLATAIAPVKEMASPIVYRMALKKLAMYGVTPEWAAEIRTNMDFSDPQILPYLDAARMRLRREGYDKMYFFISKKTKTKIGAVIELIGVKSSIPREDVLVAVYTTDTINNYITAKETILRQYTEYQNT